MYYSLPIVDLSMPAFGYGSQTSQEPIAAPVIVKIQQLHSAKLQNELNYSGPLEGEGTAMIGFAVPGPVSNVYVQEGEFVKHGQLLASIN